MVKSISVLCFFLFLSCSGNDKESIKEVTNELEANNLSIQSHVFNEVETNDKKQLTFIEESFTTNRRRLVIGLSIGGYYIGDIFYDKNGITMQYASEGFLSVAPLAYTITDSYIEVVSLHQKNRPKGHEYFENVSIYKSNITNEVIANLLSEEKKDSIDFVPEVEVINVELIPEEFDKSLILNLSTLYEEILMDEVDIVRPVQLYDSPISEVLYKERLEENSAFYVYSEFQDDNIGAWAKVLVSNGISGYVKQEDIISIK